MTRFAVELRRPRRPAALDEGTGAIRSDYDRDETIEETAELVTRLGGVGIAVQVDHLDSVQVRRLAERMRLEHSHIDVLARRRPVDLSIFRSGGRCLFSAVWDRSGACNGIQAALRVSPTLRQPI